MNQSTPQKGVVLPQGHTGSSLWHRVLQSAVARFPQVLGPARLPLRPGDFKRDYCDALVRFEGCRAASDSRVDIARFLVQETNAALQFATGGGVVPLAAHLQARGAAPPSEERVLSRGAGLEPEVPWEGRRYRGREIAELAERLRERGLMSDAACAAFGWITNHIADRGGRLDLSGERYAVLGAGAELAPTRLLLAAGASVLWVDVAAPDAVLGRELGALSGRLISARGASNLLEQPAEIAAAIERFAADGPVHLGLFAYASGASREWRLAATMNAIAASLPPACVRSVSMLVSPTTVLQIPAEAAAAADVRATQAPAWQYALRRLRLLRPGGYDASSGVAVSRAAVSVQGLSYQAAQYVSKVAAAETFAVHGRSLTGGAAAPVTVSANVAGITRTRSLKHPLFEAAFIGAPRFSVQIFAPETTRALSGLLMMHDLLNPGAPGSATHPAASARQKAEWLLSEQVHGGVYSLPYELESAIRVAALIGVTERPSLLVRALRQGRKADSAAGLAPELSAAE